jgi:hypothetical protein
LYRPRSSHCHAAAHDKPDAEQPEAGRRAKGGLWSMPGKALMGTASPHWDEFVLRGGMLRLGGLQVPDSRGESLEWSSVRRT